MWLTLITQSLRYIHHQAIEDKLSEDDDEDTDEEDEEDVMPEMFPWIPPSGELVVSQSVFSPCLLSC